MHSWEPSHRASLRHRVALEAARLLYSREFKEYYPAKLEAARRQGARHLPSNGEVQQQLQLLAKRLEGDDYGHRLMLMRQKALALMEVLSAFQPRLIGSVLKGHIRQGSDIDLHLYSDDLESICQALADYRWKVEHVRSRKGNFTHIQVEVGQDICEITLYPLEDLSTRPRCSITGGPMQRATLPEVRQLVAAPVQPSPPSSFRWHFPASPALLQQWVPELKGCQGVQQNHYHHLDVHDHTLEVVRHLEELVLQGFAGPWAPLLLQHIDPDLLLLAGVCHDLGKPATQSLSRHGQIRFLGHEEVSAQMVLTIGPRLGLSPVQQDGLRRLVACHMEAILIPSESQEPSRIYRLLQQVGPFVPELALLSLADVSSARGPAQDPHRVELQREFIDFLLQQYFEQGFLLDPCMPVTRDDLIEEFAITQTKAQHRLLDWLTCRYVDGEFHSQEEGLSLVGDYLSDPSWR